jgi:hypothetical protein
MATLGHTLLKKLENLAIVSQNFGNFGATRFRCIPGIDFIEYFFGKIPTKNS